MEIGREEYPEQIPNDLPRISTIISPVFIARTVIEESDIEGVAGNAIEAAVVGPDAINTADQIYRQYGEALTRLGEHTAVFARQLQATETFGQIFFEGVNRAYGQAQRFWDRDALKQMESSEEAMWRLRLANHQPASEITIPHAIKGLRLEVAPRIRTMLPHDSNSLQEGYIDTYGRYDTRREQPLDTIPTFPIPLFVDVQPDVSLQMLSESLTIHPEVNHKVVKRLSKAYRACTDQQLKQVHAADAVAVVPGLTHVGKVESIGMNLAVESIGCSDSETLPGLYWFELFKDGEYQGGHLYDTREERILSSNQDFLIRMPPFDDTQRPLSPQAFTRKLEDVTVSLTAMPLRRLYNPLDCNPNFPVRKYKAHKGAVPISLQLDDEHRCIVVHVGVVGSY